MRVLLWVLGLLLVVSVPAKTGGAEPKTQRPNVLILLADDQRADTIAALGNSVIKTPSLDRLARQGMAFNRAYMQGGSQPATCVTSRAMLMSGRSLFHLDENLLQGETWPAAFSRAGYTTFITGKWHNGDRSLLSSFSQGGSIFSGGMTNPLEIRLRKLRAGKLLPPEIAGKHGCEIFANEAIAFLKQPQSAPFFCYVPFVAPHDPHIVPKDFPVQYDPAKIPLPKNFLAEHPWDNGELTVRDELLLPSPRVAKQVQQMNADYYRYISYLDSQIGRILDALEASPHAKNTLVIFSADSGAARGSHGLIGKQNVYEHSVRVPLLISGPGVASGKQTDAMCYLFDLLPTLGKVCSVPAPVTSQGRSFAAVLRNPDELGRSQLLFGYRDMQRAVRNDRWKLIRYPRVDKTQLFDLQTDPDELNNLAGELDHAKKLSEMTALLAAEQKLAGDELPWMGISTEKAK